MASLFARCDCDLYDALFNKACVDKDGKVRGVELKEVDDA